jgi:hypothetical protein
MSQKLNSKVAVLGQHQGSTPILAEDVRRRPVLCDLDPEEAGCCPARLG